MNEAKRVKLTHSDCIFINIITKGDGAYDLIKNPHKTRRLATCRKSGIGIMWINIVYYINI